MPTHEGEPVRPAITTIQRHAAITGERNNIVIPRLYLEWVDWDYIAGVVLRTITGWCTWAEQKRGKDEFWHTESDWQRELHLSLKQVNRAISVINAATERWTGTPGDLVVKRVSYGQLSDGTVLSTRATYYRIDPDVYQRVYDAVLVGGVSETAQTDVSEDSQMDGSGTAQTDVSTLYQQRTKTTYSQQATATDVANHARVSLETANTKSDGVADIKDGGETPPPTPSPVLASGIAPDRQRTPAPKRKPTAQEKRDAQKDEYGRDRRFHELLVGAYYRAMGIRKAELPVSKHRQLIELARGSQSFATPEAVTEVTLGLRQDSWFMDDPFVRISFRVVLDRLTEWHRKRHPDNPSHLRTPSMEYQMLQTLRAQQEAAKIVPPPVDDPELNLPYEERLRRSEERRIAEQERREREREERKRRAMGGYDAV